MPKTIIAAKTEAEISASVTVITVNHPVSFIAHGLSVGEEVAIEVKYGEGDEDFQTLASGGGAVLDTENNTRQITAIGVYRANKPATASAVSVAVASASNP